MKRGLVEIARFHYRHEAELARGYLQHAGIPCLLNVDDAGGAEVGLSFGIPARLRVLADHAVEARRVLSDAGILEPEPEGEPGWREESSDVLDEDGVY